MSHTMDRKPILSISLMSNGKKNTVRKCLDSLVPIMKAVPSELIIVDTGCDETTAAILREYTENIVPFAWCNDFSKARNAGLMKASGEWFMYIDDDEWFPDASVIIDFFVSGEYKKYGYANYIVRNYKDYEESTYQDDWVGRLVKLCEDTRFVSPIHEYLFPIEGKCKLLNCYVKHFGYVFESEEEKLAHSQRNISLLKNVLEKEPDTIRWWTQLAQEYFVIKDYDKLKKLCVDGIEYFKNRDTNVANSERGTFYLGLIMSSLAERDLAAADKYFKQAIADKRNTGVCNAMLYARIAEMYFNQKRYEECRYCCVEYIKLYDVLNGDEDAIFFQGALFTYDVCKMDVRNNVYSFYIKCCLLDRDVDGFITYFNKMGWEEENINIYHTFIGDVLEGMAVLPYTDEFVHMAQMLMERRGINQLTVEKLKEIEKTNPQQFEALYNIFSRTNPPVLYRKVEQKDFSKELFVNHQVTTEMQQLAVQIKGQIRVLLNQGLYAEAKGVLEQLKTFIPMDEDLVRMEQTIYTEDRR